MKRLKMVCLLCLAMCFASCADSKQHEPAKPTDASADIKLDMSADTTPDTSADLASDMSFDLKDISEDISTSEDQPADMKDPLTLCGADQHVVSNQCEPCPNGTTNEAGDDPNINTNTTCDARLCVANQFVRANTCQACPNGTTNAAGDDASGPDTACDDPCFAVFGVDCQSVQTSYLKASNSDQQDTFGTAIAVHGETIVIGAPYESSNASSINGNQIDNSLRGSGAAYVFERRQGRWIQSAYLKAPHPDTFDFFGTSVDINGDTIVVGASREDSNAQGIDGNQMDNSAEDSGAVYVFTRNNGGWIQSAYLKASNPDENDHFGRAVAIDGDTIVVGAHCEDSNAQGNETDNSTKESGAAYVFQRQDDGWVQSAYLKASNPDADDVFGKAVAIDGDTIVVGAEYEASNATGINGNQMDNSLHSSGAAYIFSRQNGVWIQSAYLKASHKTYGFGTTVAIDGDTIVVGAPKDYRRASYSGAVYVFTRQNGVWSQHAPIKTSNPDEYDFFGRAVAIHGDTILVGANFEDSNASGINGNQTDNSAENSGAVYVFARQNGVWSQHAYIKAPNPDASDRYGNSVVIDGETIVVSATYESSNAKDINGNQRDNSAPESGAVYVYSN